jgi:hypothetical protein
MLVSERCANLHRIAQHQHFAIGDRMEAPDQASTQIDERIARTKKLKPRRLIDLATLALEYAAGSLGRVHSRG